MSNDILFSEINKSEVDYLHTLSPDDERISAILARIVVTPVCLNSDQAHLLRDYLGDHLARVGFDSEYVLTTQGEILECLIDKLFVP